MDSLDKLAKLFARFPGIGERQSKRFVYFLLATNHQYRDELSQRVAELRDNVTECPSCHVFFEGTQGTLCSICNNPKVNTSALLVIEKDADYTAVKRSKLFDGRMFLFGGLVPIVEKETPSYVRIDQLLKTIEERTKDNHENLKEIILAFSMTPQGEHTDQYVRERLASLIEKYSLKISSLGRGLSTGTEIEYSDSETLKSALDNRK